MGDLLRQGNIFTSVCHSVHGVCVSQHALGQTTPLGRHLSLADTPGGHPSHLGRQPPRHIPPPGQIPSRADILQADTPPPGQTPPSRPPWTHIPFPVHAGIHTPCPLHAGIHIPSPAQCMLGYTHPPTKNWFKNPLITRYQSAYWDTPPRGHCCRRYASYWNAFLFTTEFSSGSIDLKYIE